MAKQKKRQKTSPRKPSDSLASGRRKRPPLTNEETLFPIGTNGDQSSASKGDVRPAEPDRSEARTAAAGDDSLFQSYGDCCDKQEVDAFVDSADEVRSAEDLGEFVEREYRLRPCRCRKWFCPYCGPRLGIRLRGRLLARLATFSGVFGVTLTVDGSLFPSPEKSWQYVMENRLLSRFVRELDRSHFLRSRAYFWVVEFQNEKTKQPHWHLLLDSIYVPYGEIVEIWSRFRPVDAAPLLEEINATNYRGQAPAFGSVRFTFRGGDKVAAGFYATKYLTKYPHDGYPNWVLDRVGRMPRYGHSHRLFARIPGHDPSCFCRQCRGDSESPPQTKPVKKADDKTRVRKVSEPTTIGERVERCGNRCVIVQVSRIRLPDGAVVDGRTRFEANLKISFEDACRFVGVSPNQNWQVPLRGDQATALEDYARGDETQEAA